jgi:hypothetical protein
MDDKKRSRGGTKPLCTLTGAEIPAPPGSAGLQSVPARRSAAAGGDAERERHGGRGRGWVDGGYEGWGGSIVACTGRCGRTRWFYRLLHETRCGRSRAGVGRLELLGWTCRAAVICEAVRGVAFRAFFFGGGSAAQWRAPLVLPYVYVTR